jgi:membrane protease YdiL (CAAX protease family)
MSTIDDVAAPREATRTGAWKAVLLASFVTFTMLPITPAAWSGHMKVVVAVLGAAAVLTRQPAAMHLGLYCALGTACGWFFGRWIIWPFPFAIALCIYAGVVLASPPLRKTFDWPRRGELGGKQWLLIGACVALSSGALLGWFLLFRPDVSDLTSMVPAGTPVWMLIAGAVGFSLINAAVEEAIWRGVLLSGLEKVMSVAPAVLLQGVSFGIAHINGFPRGWVGVGLATVYGVMMGIVRVHARGMRAPYIAHVFADLTIMAILVTLAF